MCSEGDSTSFNQYILHTACVKFCEPQINRIKSVKSLIFFSTGHMKKSSHKSHGAVRANGKSPVPFAQFCCELKTALKKKINKSTRKKSGDYSLPRSFQEENTVFFQQILFFNTHTHTYTHTHTHTHTLNEEKLFTKETIFFNY